MTIQDIILLWNRSKYDRLMIKGLPCVDSNGEITWGTAIYRKGQTILCGGEYNVEDYLRRIYNGSIFILDNVEDCISFKMIMKGNKW